jgi:hypothetical protein
MELLGTEMLAGASGLAVTAEDVMKKMSKQERFSYLTGLIDMRAFQLGQTGDAEVSKCIYDAYYREAEGSAWSELFSSLEKFSDKQPAAIVYLLIQKTCPH